MFFCTRTATTTRARPRRRLVCRPLDLLFFIYFVVHIPTTVLIDAQILLPSHFFPEALRGLLEYWVTMSGDPFIRLDQAALDPSLVWYATFVAGELIFQLPFFFYAALQLYRDSPCLPLPLAIYGAHVSTTVAPILASVWLAVPHLTMDQRYILTSAYAPYLIIPLLMVGSVLCSATWSAHNGCPVSGAGQKVVETKKDS